MSDLMTGMSYSALLRRYLYECKEKDCVKLKGKRLPLFKGFIESPFGPAAGPHTQMAQNIVTAYIYGARFFELKTVQKMDGRELAACVAKPCISSYDEGYNCEWSTELTVGEAMEEYIKAYFVIKLLAAEKGLGDPDGFAFNMSVGYDLEGIRGEKVDTFIESLKDASDVPIFKSCMEDSVKAVSTGLLKKVDENYVRSISPEISDSVTLSTLHGCPAGEIEKIAAYLIKEKGLNTFVKCNPTLLGYETARKILDENGFDQVAFDDHHFKEDLQWQDAVPMIERLGKLATECSVEFGVKLTNTFPVDVKRNELPSEEMYMSGRSLFPLTLTLSKRITDQFGGKVRISFSGGADRHSIRRLYDAGIWPVTMATTLLKPGGYRRFRDMAGEFSNASYSEFKGVSADAVSKLLEDTAKDPRYKRPIKGIPDRKNGKPLPLFDCYTAPCSSGCPICQDIPAYVDAMERGDAVEALNIITDRNPLPFTTGSICPQTCAKKCMRNHYESAVNIRDTKHKAAVSAFDELMKSRNRAVGGDPGKAAVIGAGPGGLAAAYFLSRGGFDVTIFEKEQNPGGTVRNVIPDFRVNDNETEMDVKIALSYGAKLETGKEIKDLIRLKENGYDFMILANGAEKPGDPGLEYGETLDALDFLRRIREGRDIPEAGSIAVIGGGNTAMDCARAAKRLQGAEKVSLVYRRTRRYMPADEEELEEALEDGVEFLENLAPVGFRDGVLKCRVMKAGEMDASGRPKPVDTGETVEIKADLLISAVGERTDAELLKRAGASLNEKGLPVLNEYNETTVHGLYVVGDAAKGPATVVKAIASAMKTAEHITGVSSEYRHKLPYGAEKEYLHKRGVLKEDLHEEPDNRCLGCPYICGVCAEVCPNRANIVIEGQILHLDSLCNECGNCAVFCPYDGKPYKDKFTLYSSKEAFDEGDNEGFYLDDSGKTVMRLNGNSPEVSKLVEAVVTRYRYLL
ncbi:MAG: putative selenate reductase subunit YgfK [Lachnospiraceae bacterium]|nr:putative selenate reductase subunit YgfK [Lachnospiraceae bacterium]